MGTGYTRNDTDNNIADGNVINAADFDGEFDAIVTAFSTSGHTHDGTSAEGGPVSVVGPAQDITVSATIVSPKSNNAIDLGTDALEFKDLYLDGVAYIDGFGRDMLVATDKKVQFRDTAIFINSSTDGQLDIDADTELEITAPTVDINASTAVLVSNDLKLDSDSAVLGFGADNDTTLTHTDGTGLTINSTNKLTFGDAASFVQQSSDGVLRIDGEATVDINASTAVLVSNDLKLDSDAAVLGFGVDNEITVTHVADTGLTITNTNAGDNTPIVLQLKSQEDILTANEVIASLEFAAGDSDGTDAATVAAGIHAIAENTFESNANPTKLVFTTGVSETAAASATAKMTLSSTGDLTIADDLLLNSDSAVLSFGADSDTTLTHTDGSGLTLNSTNKIMFNDASQFIQGSSGTVLSLGATDEIDLTATAIDINGTLDVSGSAVFNTSVEVVTSDNSTQLTLKSTDADASVGPVMVFERESASAAGDDEIGRILFVGRNSENNADVTYGSIETHINAAAAASAGGYMKFRVASHDGETQSGLEIRDGNAEDEVDVTIGNAVGSLTTIKGDVLLDHDGAVLNIGADSDLKITHDGTNGDFESAGELTFDVASNIVFDADGGVFRFKDDGTEILNIANDSSNVNFNTKVSDKDLVFTGNDGGSTVIALTLDMSAAGTATFGNAGGNATAIIQGSSGAGSTNQPGTDLQLKGGAGGGTGGSNMKFFTAPGGTSGTSESAAVERMQINNNGDVRIYSSAANVGRLGLAVDGTTLASVNDSTGVAVVQLGQASFLTQFDFDGVGSVHLANNVYYNGSNLIAPFAGAASDFYQSGGGHYFRTRASGSAGSMSLTERLNIDVNGNFNFNDQSNDQDFRVESNSHAHFFYVDGGSNSGRGHITMGDFGTTDSGNMVTISSPTTNALRAQIAGNGTAVELVCTDTDANAGPNLDLNRIATGANSDVLGFVRFIGGDNGGNTGHVYAQLGAKIQTATHGAEDGIFVIETLIGNSAVERMQMNETETVFNEGSTDLNFRVEGDSNANLLLVDAGTDTVGIGTTQMNAVGNNVAGINFLGDGQGNFSRDGGIVLRINRKQDGDLVDFRSAAVVEGTIDVSGNDVTYGGFTGAHESSGIPTNTLKGTVVSTIDELDIYPAMQGSGKDLESCPKAGQTRANHAKVEVSNSIGDPCVYGVVSRFNNHDKAIIASVGIGSVRVTGACAKGDLLESNGDGTAKVQSDDIVRSKTIGKVTIGNSDSGVKLVSCVLYCG